MVNVVSIGAVAAVPVLPAHSVAKAASLSVTQSLRALLAGRGVSVYAVMPGPIDTDMVRALDIPKTPPEDVARATLDGVERGEEEIFPDPMSRLLADGWRAGVAPRTRRRRRCCGRGGALERFEPRVQFQTWLYRIATNACLDELERRPRRPEPVDPFPDRPSDETASPTYDPAARYAIRKGMELALLRAIQELPGRQRAVLIFRDVLGWTAPGVDAMLRMPPQPSLGGGLQIARFFLVTVAQGDLTRYDTDRPGRMAGPL